MSKMSREIKDLQTYYPVFSVFLLSTITNILAFYFLDNSHTLTIGRFSMVLVLSFFIFLIILAAIFSFLFFYYHIRKDNKKKQDNMFFVSFLLLLILILLYLALGIYLTVNVRFTTDYIIFVALFGASLVLTVTMLAFNGSLYSALRKRRNFYSPFNKT
jgi:amino acid transporter